MNEEFHLNPGQQRAWEEVLKSGARYQLIYGGSRSGKTFLFCKAIADRAFYAPKSRHLIIRKAANSVRRAVGMDGGTFMSMMALAHPGYKPRWREQHGFYEMPDGAEVWLGGLDDAAAMEKVLGNEYATIYCNEASEIPYEGFVLLKTRLAQKVKTRDGGTLSQRFYADLNPTTRTHWTYRLWHDHVEPEEEKPVDGDDYAFTVINPYDNAENLTAESLAMLEALPERARKRFLLGEYTGDVEHALWSRDSFKRAERGRDGKLSCEMKRIVVGVDPAISNEMGSNETGIICAGVGTDGVGYVLEDESGRMDPPAWAKRAISLYDEFQADAIVGEVNQGGDMVEHTLRAQGFRGRFVAVRASRGKHTRAEPVAALYERGKVFHVGRFPALEDQMCQFTSDFDSKSQGYSPDRVDALVWAFTQLFPQIARPSAQGPAHWPDMGLSIA